MGADAGMRDMNGQTAYDIAFEIGFTKCMTLMSQFAGGNLGPVKESRGHIIGLVRCPMGCGLSMYAYEVPEHSEICLLRQIQCPHNCGEIYMLAKELDEHYEVCATLPCPCVDCKEIIKRKDMQYHLDHQCPARKVECDYGCGKLVRLNEMGKHHRFCIKRPRDCELFCGEIIPDCDMKQHVMFDCMKRRASCPLKCPSFIVAEHLPNHLKDTCPNRPLPCKWCKENFMAKDIKYHERHCDSKLILCLNGCGEEILEKMQASHTENCTHKQITCPNNCGRSTKLCDLNEHLLNQCDERMIICPRGCTYSDEHGKKIPNS